MASTKTKYLDIWPCEGQDSGVVLVKDAGGERDVRLPKYDRSMKRLKALIVATGKPWDKLVELVEHEEYGEYVKVVGGIKGKSALDSLKALHKK